MKEHLQDPYYLTAVGILLFAASLRLYILGERVLHFDEGQVLYFVHLAVDEGEWSYSPALHGPLMSHIASATMRWIGDTSVLFRLPSAAFGVGIVATPLLLREELGDRGSAIGAALLATSPLLLYYTRFFRSDPALLFFSALAFVFAARFFRTGRGIYIPALVLAAALASTAKENFPVEIGMVLVFLFGSLLADAPTRPVKLLRHGARGIAKRWHWLALSAALAYLVFVATYAPRPIPGTADLLNTPLDVLTTALEYWSEQGGGHEPYLPFYVSLFAIAEPLLLVAGITGAYEAVDERDRLGLFLLAWFLADLIVYSVIGDGRMPWLGLYPLFPLALLGGVGLDRLIRIWREADRASTIALVLGGVLLLLGHGYQAAGANYVWYDDAAGHFEADPFPSYEGSIVVQWAQPDRGVGEILDVLDSQARQRHGEEWRDLRVQVVSNESLMHPLPWYLREYGNVEYVEEPKGGVPVLLIPGDEELGTELDGYRSLRGHLTPGDPLTMYYVPVDGS